MPRTVLPAGPCPRSRGFLRGIGDRSHPPAWAWPAPGRRPACSRRGPGPPGDHSFAALPRASRKGRPRANALAPPPLKSKQPQPGQPDLFSPGGRAPYMPRPTVPEPRGTSRPPCHHPASPPELAHRLAPPLYATCRSRPSGRLSFGHPLLPKNPAPAGGPCPRYQPAKKKGASTSLAPGHLNSSTSKQLQPKAKGSLPRLRRIQLRARCTRDRAPALQPGPACREVP